jgi:hypothetical protein
MRAAVQSDFCGDLHCRWNHRCLPACTRSCKGKPPLLTGEKRRHVISIIQLASHAHAPSHTFRFIAIRARTNKSDASMSKDTLDRPWPLWPPARSAYGDIARFLSGTTHAALASCESATCRHTTSNPCTHTGTAELLGFPSAAGHPKCNTQRTCTL